MAFERIGPDQAVGGDVAGFGRVNALEPRLGFAPPKIAAAGDIKAVLMKNGHAVKIAGAFAAVADVLMNVSLGRGGIEIELPDFFQLCDSSRSFLSPVLFNGFKGVNHAVSGAEENHGAAINFAE